MIAGQFDPIHVSIYSYPCVESSFFFLTIVAYIRDTFKKISESGYQGFDTLITSDSDNSEENELDERHISKRNLLHNKKKQQQHQDVFLTAPATNTSTNTTTSIL